VPYVVGLCSEGTPQASQAGSCSMPRPIGRFRRGMGDFIIEGGLQRVGGPPWIFGERVGVSSQF
jgi:hypothetical protein